MFKNPQITQISQICSLHFLASPQLNFIRRGRDER
jgi:hypothetical protein